MSDAPPRSGLIGPRALFVVGVLLLLLAWALWPGLQGLLGGVNFNRWFMDSHAVLTANDTLRAGLDPMRPNPHDPLGRSPHTYSDWWFVLGKLGLTRADNFLVGGIWVMGFLAALFLTVQPRSRTEGLWLVVLAGSPPFIMGIQRANGDLVIFTLLALGLLAWRSRRMWGLIVAIAAVAVATGLKFYPIAAGLVFLLVQPLRRRWLTVAAALLASGAVLWSVRDQVQRGAFLVAPEIYTMGARIWLQEWGVPLALTKAAAVALLGGAAVVVVWRKWTRGLAEEDTAPAERAMMTVGAALLVFCFLATVNYGYRWIYVLWVAPWIWRQRETSRAAKILTWLLPVVLWQDGMLALVTEWFFAPMPQANYDRALVIWHRVTQPLVWVVMVLLTGWLLDLVWTRLRELRAAMSADSKTDAAQ